jgi:eukaryotic-like serine/threonine-protein kinase
MSERSGKEDEPMAVPPSGAADGLADPEMPATVAYLQHDAGQPATDSDAAANEGTLSSGALLKHFRIVRLIGRGGMGDVYEAHDESLERTVAIKVLRAARKIAPGDHARLIHEARAQARINHPHVVQIYYVGLEPDCPFLAMELVRGTTLAERIRQTPLTFRDMVRIALQIVEGLRRAAEMQIVHADIKPSNILLDEAGTAKLSDFGLAQRNLTDDKHTPGLTGTPQYMAPELLDGGRSTFASDMYALGITLYELTLGRYPYSQTATTVQQQFDLHRSADIAFPEPWPAAIPDGWKDLLARLLAKQPEKRYPDYGRLHAEIAHFQPMTRLPAAIMPRGLAWFIDLVLLTFVMAVIGLAQPILAFVPLGLSEAAAGRVTGFTVNLMQAGVFGLLVLAHARFKTTPGKWLFQISITDQHGLPLTPIRLMPRLVLSQLPVSLSLVFESLGELTGVQSNWLMLAEAILAAVWFIGNVASLLIDARRLALHDRLLGTRAVVDHAR